MRDAPDSLPRVPDHPTPVARLAPGERVRYPVTAALLDWWAAPHGGRMRRFYAFQILRARARGVNPTDSRDLTET